MKKLSRTEIPMETMENIEKYFSTHKALQSYKVIGVLRASNHPDDWYLFHVIAKKGDSYSCWTCWNESTQCLNFGHYGLDTMEMVMEILNEMYWRV